MVKHKKWTLEDKAKIVKEFKKGATISYLNNKYGIVKVNIKMHNFVHSYITINTYEFVELAETMGFWIY